MAVNVMEPPRPTTALRNALRLPFDPLLALAVVGLAVCSLLAVRASSPGDLQNFYVSRQAAYFVLGLILAVLISRVDYSRLRELKYGIYTLMMGGIIAVLVFGSVSRGSRLSIEFPFFSFQASELGKVLLVVALAGFLVDRARRLDERDTTARTLLLGLVPAAIVMIAPDLGSATVYVVVALALLFVAGTSWKHFAALAAVAGVAVVLVLVAAPAVGVSVLEDYQTQRFTAFLNPSQDPADAGYQQAQSQVAIGSGQKVGRGELATQTRLDFLPEARTDFIYAAVGERWGFVGAGLVLSLYALLIWRGLRILTMAKNLFGALIAGGIVAMVLFQVFINVGMNVGIMPITGIALPLMTYGGSSVISNLLAVGLLQSIYAQGRATAARKSRVPAA